jgi:O-antigen/teichoic acid export membrane protein
MKFVSNVYMGVQLPSVSNFIMACGQTLALVGTWLLYHSGKADFLSIVIVNTTAPLMANMLIYPYTFYKRYPALRPSWKFVDMHVALGLANLGVKFFWLQIVGIVQFMTANILISIFFTPAAVTPYQITYRYISIVLVIFSVIFMPYWTATTDAYERGDIQWIRDANRRMNFFTVIIAVIIMFMVVVSPWVYDIWIGDKCEIPYEMTVMMGLYIFLIVSSMRYSYFLNGIGALRLQLIMSFLVIFYIPVLYLVNMYMHNILYFMVAMCMFTIPALVVNVIQLNKIISFRAKGIWRK